MHFWLPFQGLASLRIVVQSRREKIGVGPGVDRPVLGRAAWGDTIQGDTIWSDGHPLWEIELWPIRLSL